MPANLGGSAVNQYLSDERYWSNYGNPQSAPAPAPAVVLDANRTPAPQPKPPETLEQVLYGRVIPISGGRRPIRGRPIWWTKPRTVTIQRPVSSTESVTTRFGVVTREVTTTETVTATVMDMAVSFGYPLTSTGKRAILRIKAGIKTASTVIYDMTASPPVHAVGLDFTFYPGSEDQLPDPTIEAERGVGETSAYRGQMYAVFRNFPIDLFTESGEPVMPLLSALIADDSSANVVAETMTILTGSTIRTAAAVDWESGIAYFSGRETSYRLIVFNMWGARNQIADLPIVNLSTNFQFLEKQLLYIDGLQLLLAVAGGAGVLYRLVLIDPQTGRIICESPDLWPSGAELLGFFSWSVDTSGAKPLYVFAVYGSLFGKIQVYRYDPATNVITQAYVSGNNLDGHATSGSLTSIVRGQRASGRCVFYVGSAANLTKIVVDLDNIASPLTYSNLYTAAAAINLLHFLPQENAIVAFLNSGVAVKVNCATAAVLWSKSPGFTVFSGVGQPIMSTEGWRRSSPFFGYTKTGVGPGFWLLDLTDGTATFTAYASVPSRQFLFDSASRSFLFSDFGGDPVAYSFGLTATSSYAYSGLVLGLAERAGYADGQVTVSGIPDTFGGVIIDEDTPFLDFVLGHRELLNYQVVEDSAIRIFRIPDSPTVNFTIDDSMCVDAREGPITVRDEQETSFASQLEIQYRDPETDYDYNSQPVQRPLLPVPTTASNRRDAIRTQLIMSSDQAVTLATPVIYRRAAAATKLVINGMPLLAAAAPGDIVVATQGPNSYTAMVKQDRLAANLQNQIVAEVILTQSGFARSGAAGDATAFEYVPPATASNSILLDGPIINYRDDLGGAGLYFRWAATSRGQDNWSGAQFFYALDNVNYAGVSGTAVDSQVIHVGIAMAALADNPAPFLTDYTNTLTVVPTAGDFSTLASVTYAQMLEGDTLAYLGAPGRWEVIAFETITNNGNGTYSFSGLMRGLYGTEVFSGQHQAGDQFVLIGSDDGIHAASFPAADLNAPFYYKAVGIGQAIVAAYPKSGTISGNAERPPAPVHLDAVISGSDILLSCVRRSRFVQHLTDWSVLESETADGWEFEVMNGGNVVQTLSSTTPSATYQAADITADFGSMPASLTFRAYRLGHNGALSVGRGFRAQATVALS